MSNKTECPSCGNEQPNHFFVSSGICIACAASKNKEEPAPKVTNHYTEEEPECTACQG